jgi:hypothetical protein
MSLISACLYKNVLTMKRFLLSTTVAWALSAVIVPAHAVDEHGWLGLKIQAVTPDIAASLDHSVDGALIASLMPDGRPKEQAYEPATLLKV